MLASCGADPHISSIKNLRPAMVATNAYIKLYLTQVEKAHSILRFIYDIKTRNEILTKIKEVSLSVYEEFGDYLYAMYIMFSKGSSKPKVKFMTFNDLIHELQRRISKRMENPKNTKNIMSKK